ncbi:MAG: OmpA family protein [Trichloromonas sp.]|jgi:outer membrane protein OmpA-like peptidoglycan-associated protein|nr:OmpA family protein [Trichloromonas sp.]
MKIFSSPLMLLLGVSVVGGLLFGCSPAVRENALLEQAQSAFASAQADPDVQKNAPLELQKAKDDLEKAEKSLKEGAEAPEVEHFAYLAKQRTAIAREAANVKLAEQAVEAAGAERSTVLLKARTLEADQASRDAEAARLHAGVMTAEADKSKAEALAAEEQTRKMEAQIAELQATQSERGLVITLGDVLFDTNKSELRSGARYSIDKLAAFLAEYPTRNVQIEGFTDSTGSVEYNQRLSERRAEAVRNAIAAQGIDSRRLMTRGYGVEFPVAGNESAEGRQSNRRVEIIISDEDGRILERKY